jgi:beta-phosphoglucomutase-like phosphatase (HAD superfamily)
VRIDAVLFDLDGVLVDSAGVWFHLLNAAAAAWGYPAIADATFRASFGQGIDADRVAFFPRHTNAQLAAYFDAHFLAHAAHLRAPACVPALFEALHERALATAVVTNSTAPLARALVARARASPGSASTATRAASASRTSSR